MSNDTQPEIRFLGFTEDWEERKLGEVADIIGGGTPNTNNPEYWNGDIDWYAPAEIGKQIYVKNSQKKISQLGLQKSSAKILPVGTILFTSRAGIGNTAILAKEGSTNQGFQSLVPHKRMLDSYFIFSRTHELKKYGEITGAGSTFIEVSGKQMAKMNMLLPTFEEQKKIGSFFKQLDNTIALHQRKLDLLKETKKGFLQKMFPKNGAKVPEIRFPGFTEDWEERKLGETKTYFTDGNYGESYPSSKDMSDKENGVPFLRGSDFSNGYLDSSNANYIKYEKHQELTSGHIKQDDIVIAVRGSLGTLGYANKENEGWNINSQLAILRTNKSEILGMFLIQYLLSNKGQKEILSRNTGTALKQLPIKQLKDIPIPMPAISEQQKIGTFFKQLDDTITLHQRKLDLLKETKKGFLQKMFV
ncbi:restriction endonuclease subunit S [Enterococcus hirae]|uniref:restriction endonuclease subunit S n=1 Tax=Enterococcus faecalis TaxID=1351 RepID=UPI0015740FF4|nr:restriction endonuclease subunit S [Enterococcus faecalis]EMF0078902.1 restriction endonuclease subunit S [Enterococcus hirae]EGO5079924.1 restriction endonuclease subunit S [Enterococcus faecalis]EGO6108770.1 restriction endonuclease subunit S [Enterococcus faecalis]EGO8096769.1 restriction endonuclease subunit S [Enterococcus faecalis]EHA4036197.1 restriction endonuclease subunit S [Enterococcus faecalis]